MSKLYIAVLDEFPDYMVPTLVAHSVLSAHEKYHGKLPSYDEWYENSFKKVVLRVSQVEFDKISTLMCHLGHENKTLEGRKSCAVVPPLTGETPKVLQFAKLWKPKEED